MYHLVQPIGDIVSSSRSMADTVKNMVVMLKRLDLILNNFQILFWLGLQMNMTINWPIRIAVGKLVVLSGLRDLWAQYTKCKRNSAFIQACRCDETTCTCKAAQAWHCYLRWVSSKPINQPSCSFQFNLGTMSLRFQPWNCKHVYIVVQQCS